MVIVAYNKEWLSQFEALKKAIMNVVTHYKNIEHIGSTSIPGMYAKPIIDITIEIENVDSFCLVRDELGQLDYVHKGNQGIEGREVFKRTGKTDHAVLDSIQHHLYVGTTDSREFQRNVLFRDYLRKHAEYVEKYNRIKMEILRRYGENDREKYVEVKERDYKWFFEEIINKSRAEKGSISSVRERDSTMSW